jgi:hypothetical protein
MPFLDFVPNSDIVLKDASFVQIPIPNEPKSICVGYFWSIPGFFNKKYKHIIVG